MGPTKSGSILYPNRTSGLIARAALIAIFVLSLLAQAGIHLVGMAVEGVAVISLFAVTLTMDIVKVGDAGGEDGSFWARFTWGAMGSLVGVFLLQGVVLTGKVPVVTQLVVTLGSVFGFAVGLIGALFYNQIVALVRFIRIGGGNALGPSNIAGAVMLVGYIATSVVAFMYRPNISPPLLAILASFVLTHLTNLFTRSRAHGVLGFSAFYLYIAAFGTLATAHWFPQYLVPFGGAPSAMAILLPFVLVLSAFEYRRFKRRLSAPPQVFHIKLKK